MILVHIFWYKFRIWAKTSTDIRVQTVVKSLASAIVYGGFAVAAYFFAREVTGYVLDKIHLGMFLLHRFLSMMLYVFFLSINVGNIIVAYAALYRSKEADYYLTQPIGFGTLFTVKFFDIFFYSSTTLFLIAVAMLAGYGSHFHVNWLFYVEALVLWFIPFMLLSASLGVIILLLLMKLARLTGSKALFVVIIAGYIGTIYSYFVFSNPVGLVNSVMRYYPYVDLYFGFLDPPLSRFVPSHWVAEGLYWTLRGNGLLAFVNTAYLLIATAVAFSVMILMGKMLYYETWLISMNLRAVGEARASRARFYSFARKPLLLDAQSSVLLKKEFWQFFREPSQWIHLGIIAMLMIVFVGSIRQVSIFSSQPFLQAVSYMVIYTFIAFLFSSIALRFVYPMISIEGPAIWSIRCAPITPAKMYRLKFFFVAAPLALLGEVLIAASHLQLRGYRMVIVTAFGTLFPVLFAFISMNLGLGGYFSDFKESNPIKISSSQGATLTFLLTIVYLVVLVAVLFFPVYAYFDAIAHNLPAPIIGMVTNIGVVFAMSSLVVLVSWLIGLKAIRRDI